MAGNANREPSPITILCIQWFALVVSSLRIQKKFQMGCRLLRNRCKQTCLISYAFLQGRAWTNASAFLKLCFFWNAISEETFPITDVFTTPAHTVETVFRWFTNSVQQIRVKHFKQLTSYPTLRWLFTCCQVCFRLQELTEQDVDPGNVSFVLLGGTVTLKILEDPWRLQRVPANYHRYHILPIQTP